MESCKAHTLTLTLFMVLKFVANRVVVNLVAFAEACLPIDLLMVWYLGEA